MNQIHKKEIKQPKLSAPVSTGGLSRLGYAFPSHVASNQYFASFIAGFERSGAERFTRLQCSMLDELIHTRAFQVTSPDVSCGSGKTSLTVAATIGLFQQKDKIIFVNKPGRGESSLTKELKQLVEKFSGGASMMSLATVLNDAEAASFVSESDVIITNCIVLGSVLQKVVDDYSVQQAANTDTDTDTPSKVYLIFDEAHKIFNHDGLTKMAAWAIEQEKEMKRRSKDLDHSPDMGSLSFGQPALSSVSAALIQLHQASTLLRSFTPVPIFLSAVGDFSTSTSKVRLHQKQQSAAESPLSSSEVIEMCISQWMKTPVTKLVNSGNNSERNYNTIFKIHREGAAQIGGVDPQGYVMVYEAMLKIALTRLVKGRMLFIVRRQQVDTFAALLDAKIAESGSFFSYTTDRDHWNAMDQDTLRPLYNIVIVREDELDDLEGVNLEGLRAVYLFSLGKTQNLYQKMQGLGRVGRLGQEASYCFVMIDCATKKNGAIEAESSPFLMEALSSSGTCRPHIIEVKGAKALDVPSNIPNYTPHLQPPTPLQLQQIQKTIKAANRPQVCKFMRYSPASGAYECPSLQNGYRCAWYHPRGNDFVSTNSRSSSSSSRSLSLKCCTFNTSFCKKGVFREARCHCVRSMAPITPLTAATVAWTATNPAPPSVLAAEPLMSALSSSSSSSSHHFPALGQGKATACGLNPTAPAASASPEVPVIKRNPRLDRPVCRFAAMDMYKCKTRREGKLCFFRHPEEEHDCVTDEEYLEALRLSLLNLNKTKAKYGQKPIKFSTDLYSKYNYPGRFKSNLAKPAAPPAAKSVSVVSEPVQTLASVLADEAVPGAGAGAGSGVSNSSQQLFAALQGAYAKQTKPKIAPKTTLGASVGPPPPAPLISMSKSDGDGDGDGEGFTDVGGSKRHARSRKPLTASLPPQESKAKNYFQLLSSDELHEEEEEDVVVVVAASPASEKEKAQQQQQQEEEEEARCRAKQERDASAALAARELHESQMKAAAAAQAVEAAAVAVVQSGLQGAKVVDYLNSLDSATATSASALARAVLAGQTASTLSYQWLTDDQLGLAMKHLLRAPAAAATRVAAQVELLRAVELFCHAQGFVKVQVKADQRYLIDVLFRLLYAYELVEEEGFFAWHECDPDHECVGGEVDVSLEEVKLRAVLQTTDFFGWLLLEDQDDSEEEQEEEDYGGYGCSRVQTPPPPQVQEEEQEQELSKADRKALKQLRRQEKVAGREGGSGGKESKLAHRHSSSSSAFSSSSVSISQ